MPPLAHGRLPGRRFFRRELQTALQLFERLQTIRVLRGGRDGLRLGHARRTASSLDTPHARASCSTTASVEGSSETLLPLPFMPEPYHRRRLAGNRDFIARVLGAGKDAHCITHVRVEIPAACKFSPS